MFFHGYITNLAHRPVNETDDDLHQATKNCYSLAPIIKPGLELLFREDCMLRNSSSNVHFSPTRFEKVFVLGFSPGDFSYSACKGYPDTERMFRAFKNDITLAGKIPKYFRCRIPRFQDVVNEDQNLAVHEINSPSSVYMKPVNVMLSTTLFEKYPLLWHTHGILASENFFSEFGSDFDPRYFEITEVKMPRE